MPKLPTAILATLVAEERAAAAPVPPDSPRTDDANADTHTIAPAISASNQYPTRFMMFNRTGVNKANLTFLE